MRTLGIIALALTMAAVAGSASYARSHARGGSYFGGHGSSHRGGHYTNHFGVRGYHHKHR